ncbi:MAG: PAS domain-containing protein [Proteobacteria bacterium]|nr:PAS domain-containing protein [Pseudomonadota bacterium]
MISNSIGIMSMIDVLIVGVVITALYIFFRYRKPLTDMGAAGGLFAVALGLGMTGAFYAAELFTMLILPGFIPRADAMSIMMELHLNYRWFLTIAATVAISIGFLIVIGKMRGCANQLEQSLAALRESEERRRLFMDSATEHFVLYDADLNVIDINAITLESRGWKKGDIIGRNMVDVFPNAAATGRLERYHEVLKTGEPFEMEIGVDFGNGRHGQIVMRVFKAGDGLGISSADITEWKKAEAALRESEETLRLFQDAATDDFALFDRDLKLLSANAPALEHLGRPLEEAVGRPLLELMPSLAGTERYARYLDIARTGGRYDAEIAVTRRDGEATYRAISAFPAGTGVGVITRDITERKRAEAALCESESRLNAFFAEAPAELVMFDRDFRYLKVNETLARTNGIPAEDHIGKPIRDLAPDLAPKIEPLFRRILETAEPLLDLELEGEVETDPGIKHTWALSIFPIPGSDGTPQGIGSISIDITERKRAERELESLNESLERRVTERTAELRATQDELINAERLAALGQLTATVAHELRNPLATIRTSVFSLRSRFQDGGEEAQTTLRRIDRNIARCDRIIAELLDFSANQEPCLETVDLNQCVAAWVGDYVASEGARLRLAISDGAATVRIDQDRLHQVIVNLLDNALQAQEESPGRARRDAEIAVRTRVEDGHFILEVADDGPGIPDDVLPRIFEPLYSTKGFGVGLGLPLVKKIIDQHGGGIEVNTGVGDGTTFRIRIPLTTSGEAAA